MGISMFLLVYVLGVVILLVLVIWIGGCVFVVFK